MQSLNTFVYSACCLCNTGNGRPCAHQAGASLPAQFEENSLKMLLKNHQVHDMSSLRISDMNQLEFEGQFVTYILPIFSMERTTAEGRKPDSATDLWLQPPQHYCIVCSLY